MFAEFAGPSMRVDATVFLVWQLGTKGEDHLETEDPKETEDPGSSPVPTSVVWFHHPLSGSYPHQHLRLGLHSSADPRSW